MKLEAVLFDLDGTLIDMDAEAFENAYIGSLSQAVASVIEPKLFVKALWTATNAMVRNDGSTTNEILFYDVFSKEAGEAYIEPLQPILEHYYAVGFDAAKSTIKSSEAMREAVRILKSKGIRVIVATNPMFPPKAVEKRLQWGGFEWDDFEHVTHYEICHYCKPNPKYFAEILEVTGLDAQACMMVGNDAQEDLVAKTLGLTTYLIEDDLIHRGGDIDTDYAGTREDFLAFVKAL